MIFVVVQQVRIWRMDCRMRLDAEVTMATGRTRTDGSVGFLVWQALLAMPITRLRPHMPPWSSGLFCRLMGFCFCVYEFDEMGVMGYEYWLCNCIWGIH